MQFDHFLSVLRSALNNLYDPDYLRKSPLLNSFNIQDPFYSPLTLQERLTRAIESLQPPDHLPIDSTAWKSYHILLYRYVQQLTVKEVSFQLGISRRQFYRELNNALTILGCKLWEENKFGECEEKKPDSDPKNVAQSQSLPAELNWLEMANVDQPLDLVEGLGKALKLIAPLALQNKVNIHQEIPGRLLDLAVHPTVFRQIILSLLNLIIAESWSGDVLIKAELVGYQVKVTLQRNQGFDGRSFAELAEKRLELTELILDQIHARLEIFQDPGKFGFYLYLPGIRELVVLVIDDNVDIVHLFQRYTEGTRYTLIGLKEPKEVFSLVAEYSPKIILLDILMPGMDGWELVGRLKEHPLTKKTPIVVCSIIDQKELALALGASDFIQKPVTQQSFLQVLNRNAGYEEQRFH